MTSIRKECESVEKGRDEGRKQRMNGEKAKLVRVAYRFYYFFSRPIRALDFCIKNMQARYALRGPSGSPNSSKRWKSKEKNDSLLVHTLQMNKSQLLKISSKVQRGAVVTSA